MMSIHIIRSFTWSACQLLNNFSIDVLKAGYFGTGAVAIFQFFIARLK